MRIFRVPENNMAIGLSQLSPFSLRHTICQKRGWVATTSRKIMRTVVLSKVSIPLQENKPQSQTALVVFKKSLGPGSQISPKRIENVVVF